MPFLILEFDCSTTFAKGGSIQKSCTASQDNLLNSTQLCMLNETQHGLSECVEKNWKGMIQVWATKRVDSMLDRGLYVGVYKQFCPKMIRSKLTANPLQDKA